MRGTKRLSAAIRPDGSDKEERKHWAREMVAALSGNPQAPLSGPGALSNARTVTLRGGRPPLSYTPLKDGIGSGFDCEEGPDHRRRRRDRLEAWKKQHVLPGVKKDVGGVRAPGLVQMPPSSDQSRGSRKGESRSRLRPGTGGRVQVDDEALRTAATAELHEALGPPTFERVDSVAIEYWTAETARKDNGFIFPDGDGILVARISTADAKKGETALGQVHALNEYAKANGLRPREIIVTTKNRGTRDYAKRWDFLRIEQGIASGTVHWVAFYSVDRMTRRLESGLRFLRFLDATKTTLHLLDIGIREPGGDDLVLNISQVMAERERGNIEKRTSEAKHRRWVGEGRGYPNAQRFGFRRDKNKFLEVDPEQWPFVKLIHSLFGTTKDGKQLGVRAVSEELERQGCPLSHEKIRKILKDPIYVTGEWTTQSQGKTVQNRAPKLDDPIPEKTFQRNQAILATTKGRSTQTKPGTYVLNLVPLYHASCLDPKKRTKGSDVPRLKARTYSDKKRRKVEAKYAHQTPVPECCRGFTVSADEIDQVVVETLRKVCETPELIDEWNRQRPSDERTASRILTKAQRQKVRQEIAAQELSKDKIEKTLTELTAEGRVCPGFG